MRATVLRAAHWLLSVALLSFISISYKTFLIKELGWKQTEFEMWPDFHNTLPSCIFHSTLPTSFACISSKTFEVRFIERRKMPSSCLGWKGEKAFFSERESLHFLPCWMSPIHYGRRGTSNNISIGTGTVATSQPADVRPPFVSWTFAICSAAYWLVVLASLKVLLTYVFAKTNRLLEGVTC